MSFMNKPGVIASIHLYGTQAVGHDTSTMLYDPKSGDLILGADERPVTIGKGDKLRPGRSATDAIFLAVNALHQHGLTRGRVEVHYDFESGPRVATFRLEERIPYFGELKWVPAEVVVISAEAIIAAAEKV